MKKKLFSFVFAVLLVLMFSACSQTTPEATPPASDNATAPASDSTTPPSSNATETTANNNDDLVGDQIGYDYGLGKVAWDLDGLVNRIGKDKVASLRIGVSVNSGTDMWPRQWGEEWDNLAKQYGFTANVLYNENDSVKEADTIATFVNQQVDGIAISPIGETIAQPITEIYGKIPTVTCIPIPKGQVNVTVNTDQLAKGKMIADHVAQDANGAELKVLTVNNAMELPHFNARIQGFDDQSKDLYPNITVVGNVLDTTVDGYMNQVKSFLMAHPEVNTVITPYGDPLRGAFSAIQQLGKSDSISIYSVDADEATLEMLSQGEIIKGMHVQFAKPQADECFFYLLRAINGDTVPANVWEDPKYNMVYATPLTAYKMLTVWYPDKYSPNDVTSEANTAAIAQAKAAAEAQQQQQ